MVELVLLVKYGEICLQSNISTDFVLGEYTCNFLILCSFFENPTIMQVTPALFAASFDQGNDV